jgi:O-antigen/teichoic acid export membrane protein
MKSESHYSGKRFKGAIRVFLVGRATQGIANFALTLWTVRLLAPVDYGAYMALWGVVELLVPLSSLGLLEAVRRFMPELVSRGTAAAVRAFVKWTMLARYGFVLAWVATLFAVWPWFAAWLGFSHAQAEQSMVALALFFTVLGFRFTAEFLETLLEQRWSQLAQALQPIGRLLGMALLVTIDSVSLAHVLWVDVAASLLCLLLAEVALLRRLSALQLNGQYAVAPREVVAFSWHMAATNLLQATASMGALRLIAVRLLGLEAAGLFAFLQQILSLTSRYMPAQLLANIVRPMLIARQAAGETGVVRRGVSLMMKSNLLIVLMVVAVFAVAGDVIIAIASGGRFTGAGNVMLLFFLALAATSQGQLISMVMQIFDRTKALRSQSMLFLLVPLAAWLGGSYGLQGMVVGIVAGHWLRNSYALWWIERQGEGRLLDTVGALRGVAGMGLATLPGWWVSQYWGPWGALALTLALLAIFWAFFKPLSLDDEAFLTRVVKGKSRLIRVFVHRR